MVEALEAYLLQTDPAPDPVSREVTDLVAEAERNLDIVRAEQLADHAGMSLATCRGCSPSTSVSARSG